jgi:uncharacterized protein
MAHPVEETPAWRDIVQHAAHDAAIVETRVGNSTRQIVYNYRWEHVQAVVRLALRLAEGTGADPEIVEAAAWLHDIVKGAPGSADHGTAGAIAARRILAGTDFPPAKVDAVAHAIAQHVGLWTEAPVEPLEAAILWDADKLSKLGATAVLHFAGYLIDSGQGTTAQLVEGLPSKDWSIQERSVGSFHTAAARAAGARRLAAIRAFCDRATREFDAADLLGADDSLGDDRA